MGSGVLKSQLSVEGGGREREQGISGHVQIFMHREKTVPCSGPKCEVVSHSKQSRTRHPLCTGGTCRHGGGCLATGQPGFQPSLAVPKVYVVSKTPPASRPALPCPCPARAPTTKLSPPPLATGSRPAPPACIRGPEGRRVPCIRPLSSGGRVSAYRSPTSRGRFGGGAENAGR